MYLEVNNTDLYYEVSGAGPALILIHGNGESHFIFDKLIEALNSDFTVYAVDSRGHGKSEKTRVFHYSDMAEDFAEFIRLNKIEKPLIYGFSDGGIIGLLLAIKYPALISGLIASGANTRPEGVKPKWLLLFKLLYIFKRSPLIKLMLTEPDISAATLSQIKLPVLITAGSRDMIKDSETKLIAEAIPNAQLKIFKGKGHADYIIHSDFMAEVIREFYKNS
jgi:pimeloyl-ACP methyl ester carboxylesterase